MDCVKYSSQLNWNEYLSLSPSDNLYDFCIKLITRHYIERGINIYSDDVFDLIKMDCVGLALLVIDGIEAGELNSLGELAYSQQLRGCYSHLLSITDVANNHTSQDYDVQFSIHCEYIEALNNFNETKYAIHGKVKPFEAAKWLTHYAKGREFCPPSLIQFFENEQKEVQQKQATILVKDVFPILLSAINDIKNANPKKDFSTLERRTRDYLHRLNPNTAAIYGIEKSDAPNRTEDYKRFFKYDVPQLKKYVSNFPDLPRR